MADRVSASIVIGGNISEQDFAILVALIIEESLSIEWDGEPFAPDQRVIGAPLSLFAHEVAYGRFDRLEAFCVDRQLPFARWSGGYPGQWGAQRVVFTGAGAPVEYACDEEDYVVIGRGTVKKLGSIEAIVAYFDAADVVIDPLVVEGEEALQG